MLDGAPIVCIASLNGENDKTGPMVQTWILRQRQAPTQASKTGNDKSVCGDCPRRHALGGDCYVNLVFAPNQVWRAWDSAGRSGSNWQEASTFSKLRKASQSHGLRLGSYGDPAAVPHTIWQELLTQLAPKLHTGYTHQWRTNLNPWFSFNVMASVDTIDEATEARAKGYRYFLAIAPSDLDKIPGQTIMCLADREVNPKQCEECGICNGTQGKATRVSVFLLEHGPRALSNHKKDKRSMRLNVMA